jgi:hypothetical protein
MKFVYPEFLWAFGVLIIPIIIHLFNFRKYKTLYFSSLKFIQFVDQQTKSTQKLKHLLILISRILFFTFLVISFAQPYIPISSYSSKGGKPIIAIYIDNSFSMSMKGTEGELISEAREMARKIITDANLDTRFMLVTNEMSGIEQRIVSKLDALDRLDKIEISPISRNISTIIEWEKNTIKKEHETSNKIGNQQFIILSDFQKNSSDLSKLKNDQESFYYPIKLTPQESSNILIDSVWFSSPVQKIGENNELNVRVKNYGKNNSTNTELHLEIGSIKRDVFIDIKANESSVTTINFIESKEGFKKGKVSINDKQFYYDDEYFFNYLVSKKSDILIINGENAVKNISLVYSLDNFYKVTEVNQSNLISEYLKNKDLVIINGSKEITSGLADELYDYISNGGSLALFPGEDIDPSKSGWNSFLNSVKMPSLGNTFTEGVKIKNLNFDDVFFKSVFEKNPGKINLPTISKAYKSNSSTKTQSIGLIQLQNGSPLYSKSLNNFNIFLFSSSLSPSYGSFTANALFSTLLLRTAELSRRKTPISLIIGEDSKFPIYSRSQRELPIHIKNDEVDFIPLIIPKETISYLSLGGIEVIEKLKSGTYQIIDELPKGFISLNYNRTESDISCFTPTEVNTILENQGIKHILFSEIYEGQTLTKVDLKKPYEYWKLFLMFALLFLIIEMALLKFWKK